MNNETQIELIGIDEATGDLYHEAITCSGTITVSGSGSSQYRVCTSGHYEP